MLWAEIGPTVIAPPTSPKIASSSFTQKKGDVQLGEFESQLRSAVPVQVFEAACALAVVQRAAIPNARMRRREPVRGADFMRSEMVAPWRSVGRGRLVGECLAVGTMKLVMG